MAPPNEGGEPKFWVSSELKTRTTTTLTMIHRFVLDEINEIEKYIKDKRERRAALAKKYHRVSNIINGIDYTLVTASVGIEVSGIALLSTIAVVSLAIVTEEQD